MFSVGDNKMLESEWTGRAFSGRESGYAMAVMAEIARVFEMNDVVRFLNFYKRGYGSYRIVSTPWALVTLIARATERGIDYKTALGWMDFIVESQKAERAGLVSLNTGSGFISGFRASY